MEIIFSILGHPIRREILFLLEKEGRLSYSDLLNSLGINTGNLNYHLRGMRDLVVKEQKAYFLSDQGEMALELMRISQKVMSGEEIPWISPREVEIARVGIVLCNCNHEISGTIDIKAVEKYLSAVKNVVSIIGFENVCQERNIRKMKKWIRDNFITKVVLGACSPRTHQQVFCDLMNQVGIDIFEIANIREQCAWVHETSKAIATEKAKALIEAAVSKVKQKQNTPIKRIKAEKSIAVIGGGTAGILLSYYLSLLHFQVYLIERSPTLGGKASRWSRISGFSDCATCILNEEILKLTENANVTVFTVSEVAQVTGTIGSFEISVLRHPRYVIENKCIGCHRCVEECPQNRKNEYEMGLQERKVIHFPFPYSYPYVPVISTDDIENCRECRICAEVCDSKAIDLEQGEYNLTINVGAIVIATGCDLYHELQEWGYDPYNDVVTSPEFERILATDGPSSGRLLRLSDSVEPENIAIIQCVNSDTLCSHYCCELALKYIEEVREKCPAAKTEIFFDLNQVPNPPRMGKLSTLIPNRYLHMTFDLSLDTRNGKTIIRGADIEKSFDMIVLNIGMTPNKDLEKLRRVTGFAVDEYGFIREETLISGCYACGSVTGPKDYHETIIDAKDKAIQIVSKLSEEYLITNMQSITLDHEKCGLCLLCTLACPYMALYVKEDRIEIDEFKCRGCGICIPICSSKAIDLEINSTHQMLSKIEVLARSPIWPKVIAFCCLSCGYAAADQAGTKRMSYLPNVFIVRVPCTGFIDSEHILKSLELGFDGVLIFGCFDEACKYLGGSRKTKTKVEVIKNVLGKDGEKVLYIPVSAVDQIKFVDAVNDFIGMIADAK
jgi:heterodisulfide reductase subunit A